MKVLIPGFFTSIEDVHIEVFEMVKKECKDANIELLIFPKHGYNLAKTRKMLLNIAQVSEVHVEQIRDEEMERWLSEKCITCVIEFTPLAFELPLRWPKVRNFDKKRQTILQLDCEHPDFMAAARLFKIRQSPRVFKEEPISNAVLSAALDAARRSPSAGNLQAYSVILIRNKDVMKQLADASHHQERVEKCAGVFAFVVEKELSAVKYRERGEKFYSLLDATIACSHMQLALEAFGVQSRWIGAYRDAEIAKILHIGKKQVVGLLIFGYGADHDRLSGRRELGSYLTTID